MPTPLTGSLGWSGLYPLQLGGPPLVNSFARAMASPLASTAGTPQARPYIAHVYQNDGVTSLGTVTVKSRPNLMATRANGGFGQVLLDVASRKTSAVYGQVIYGSPIYGSQVAVGNIIRLTEQGGDGNFLYMGIVEDLPDSIGPSGVTHQILLTHPVLELQACFSQSIYTTPTDVAQVVRDAYAQTQHISCDQISVPATTGIFVATAGTVDFRNQSCQQQIDMARSIAGPTWFWHVDEVGRGWFQPMGSGAVYTLTRAQVQERTLSTSIQDRKNQVLAFGGVPPGGSGPVTATYNGSSQSSLGIRALNPPLTMQSITDQPTIAFLAANVGAVLDRVWTRFNLKLPTATLKQRPIMQPGGIMVRLFEPSVSAMQESETAAGGYTGPFIAQTIEDSGAFLQLVAGDIPVTSQTDVQNMALAWATREQAFRGFHPMATLVDNQTMTGILRIGSATTGTGQVVGRFEAGIGLPANGVSPAGVPWRINDGNANPLADALGLISVGQLLVNIPATNPFTSSATSPVTVTGTSATFTLTRALRLMFFWAASCSYNGQTAFVDLVLDGTDLSNGVSSPAMQLQFPTTTSGAVTSMGLYSASVAAGSHTVNLAAFQSGVASFTLQFATLLVLQLGS